MKFILYTLFAVGLLQSCADSLEEVPTSFIAKENYYQTAADAEGAIVGAYSSFRGDYFGINYYLMEELHGDYLLGRGSQAPITNFGQVLDNTNIARASTDWSVLYECINRCNTVLSNVPGIENIDEDERNRILGEAYFLRGMSYFNLVRAFGPVPLRLSASEDLGSLAEPRAPVEVVYQQIIGDVMESEKWLPESVDEQTGRASLYAAKMLLAQVYLTTEDWEQAAQMSMDIIESGNYALVEVSEPDDFYKIFAAETSTEDIMSVHHSPTHLSEIQTYIHRGNVPPYNYSSRGFYAWLPDMNSFLGTWDENDLRRDFNLYTQYLDGDGNWIDLPSSSPVLFKKFISDPDGLDLYSIPIYRYTEAFLTYAEAAAMANDGPTDAALENLNIIHRRAYGYNPYADSPVDFQSGMSLEAFRDTVIQERAYEFVLERRRWWDLKRTGKIKEAFDAVGRPYSDERLLWPIPENEINNNPELSQSDQNPGY